jgi:hypothetical protein
MVALKPPSGVVMRIQMMSLHGLQGASSILHNKGRKSYEIIIVIEETLMF